MHACLVVSYLCNPMDYSMPGSSVHGIFQAGILEWVAISYPRESSQPTDQTHISCVSRIGRQIIYHWDESLWLCGSQQTAEKTIRDRNTRPPVVPPEKSVCRSRSNSYNWTWNNWLVPNWKRSTSRLYIVTLPAYLTYMQSTSCEMLGWMKHKLGSRLPGEISITSNTQMTPPLWQKAKN